RERHRQPVAPRAADDAHPAGPAHAGSRGDPRRGHHARPGRLPERRTRPRPLRCRSRVLRRPARADAGDGRPSALELSRAREARGRDRRLMRLRRPDLGALHEREFRLLFTGQTISLLGDGIVGVALSFAVLDLTGSVSDLGYVFAARTIPLVVFLLAGGVL